MTSGLHPSLSSSSDDKLRRDSYQHQHQHQQLQQHARDLEGSATTSTADQADGNNAAFFANNNLFTLTTDASDPPHYPPASQSQFRSHTIAPSPPLPETSPGPSTTPQKAAGLSSRDSAHCSRSPLGSDSSNALRILTDFRPLPPARTADSLNSSAATLSSTPGAHRPSILQLQRQPSAASLKPISRTPSLKAAFGSPSGASSIVSSPAITAMGDVTPLPSPLLSNDSPGPWKKFVGRPPSRDGAPVMITPSEGSVLVSTNGESISSALANHVKRKSYAGLAGGGDDAPPAHSNDAFRPHTRNRSVSDYVPDPVALPKRMVTVSGSHARSEAIPEGAEPHMRREPHLSEARGLTPIEKPPTPPPSESSVPSSSDSASGDARTSGDRTRHEYFEAFGRADGKKRRWRAVKALGQGTFSRVMLATSQISPSDEEESRRSGGLLTPEPNARHHPKTLVAIKVCEAGPKGGASEERVEMSLKRELDIMQSINHPSLIHLKAWNIESTRAILVLSYCPGGDLFDVATAHRDLLSPSLLRRIFSELIGAVLYLHERRIVHRDIKLENVLVNLPPSELADTSIDWAAYPYSVSTLTDLGLSRRVADDEKLETRCGSDDYAAPEVIMGQAYDGRAVDAWSLGVLLYALLESRLPFDPHPGGGAGAGGDAHHHHRMRSRTSHRIARVEWRWVEYAGGDEGEGEHDGDEARFASRGLLGAMEITEGLLKRARSRWTLGRVGGTEWVRGGVRVEGGIRFREEIEGEEVL